MSAAFSSFPLLFSSLSSLFSSSVRGGRRRAAKERGRRAARSRWADAGAATGMERAPQRAGSTGATAGERGSGAGAVERDDGRREHGSEAVSSGWSDGGRAGAAAVERGDGRRERGSRAAASGESGSGRGCRAERFGREGEAAGESVRARPACARARPAVAWCAGGGVPPISLARAQLSWWPAVAARRSAPAERKEIGMLASARRGRRRASHRSSPPSPRHTRHCSPLSCHHTARSPLVQLAVVPTTSPPLPPPAVALVRRRPASEVEAAAARGAADEGRGDQLRRR
uniref:Uncharacterized protein n=1 Tax=Oryza meridionalis TaxID=40149 RepID=A0A0E0EZ10_9ORYZ